MKRHFKFLSYALSLCMLCTFFFSPSVLAATDRTILAENTTVMLANAVTGIRVNCIATNDHINVCFVG